MRSLGGPISALNALQGSIKSLIRPFKKPLIRFFKVPYKAL